MRLAKITAALALLLGLGAHRAEAAPILALTTDSLQRLLAFDSATPGTVSAVNISGTLGQVLLGIDFRPQNGLLYGLGSGGGVFAIDRTSGVATLASLLSTPTSGTSFGVDFNPIPDRLRVVSDNGQSLRTNVDNGATLTDSPLTYGVGDPNQGTNPNVVGSAYTNSFAGAPSTTLFGIDSNLDVLVIQNPPNAGILTTVGALGVNTSNLVGFDIAGDTGLFYASLTAPGAVPAAPAG